MKEYGTAERGRVTDAALTRSIAASVIGIMLCMACLIGTTWAWYSASLTSGENEITVADFAVNVTIVKQDAETTLTLAEDGTYTLTGGNYTVTLRASSTGSATTGFCQVLAYGTPYGTPYYTGNFINSEFTFTINVEGNVSVKFTPMWGICPTGEGINTIQIGDTIPLEVPAMLTMQNTGDKTGEDPATDEATDGADAADGNGSGGDPATGEGTDGDDAADGNGSGGESGDNTGGNEPNGESGDPTGDESDGTPNE